MADNQEEKNLTKVVSEKIETLLARKGFTKKALAAHLGITENGVKKMIVRGTFQLDSLTKISEYLQIELNELLFDSPPVEKPKADPVQDSISELVSVLKQQAEAILKNSSSIENQTITIKQNAFTIEAQRSQIADLNNKGIRRDIDVLQQSVNVLLKEKIEEQKRKDDQKGRKKAG